MTWGSLLFCDMGPGWQIAACSVYKTIYMQDILMSICLKLLHIMSQDVSLGCPWDCFTTWVSLSICDMGPGWQIAVCSVYKTIFLQDILMSICLKLLHIMSVKVWSLFPNFVDAVCFLISWPWLLIFACPCLLLVFAEQITSCSWWSYARRGKSSVLGNLPFSYQCRNLQKKEKAKNYNTLLFSLSPILYSRGASRKTKFQNLHELIFSRRS